MLKNNIRLLYLYLFSFVGLLIVTIGSIQMVDLTLKAVFFKDIDYYEVSPVMDKDGMLIESKESMEARQKRDSQRQRQRELVNAVSMIVVGVPLYLYHWGIIKKDKE